MSKQEKLISADKLLMWIDIKYKTKLPNELQEYRDGRQVILDILKTHIKTGLFNPDPVPTIKPGDKVRHKNLGKAVVVWTKRDTAVIEDVTGKRFGVSIMNLEVVNDE